MSRLVRPTTPLAIVLASLAAPALAAAPERPLPEAKSSAARPFPGTCSASAFRTTIEVPTLAGFDEADAREATLARKSAEPARRRLIAGRRLTARIEEAAVSVIATTGECDDERQLHVFRSTAEAAVQDAAQAYMPVPYGMTVAWVPAPWREGAGEPPWSPSEGRYSGACRAPALDDELFVPDAPSLSPAARAKLADVGATAAAVTAALRAQKEALDELLPLTEGARCRDILLAFDALVAEERRQFFAYREKAVAGAVWGDLTWKKAAP